MKYPCFESFKGRNVAHGQRVGVYHNLNKSGYIYSIKDVKTRLVLGHASKILLTDCTISEAWIEGNFGSVNNGDKEVFGKSLPMDYSPYESETEANLVYIEEGDIWIHA